SKMNGGNGPTAPPAGTPQEPGGGSVSLSGGNLTVTLKGATPNASYILGQDFSSGGSASQQVGNSFTTDASGNASVTVQALDSTGQIISVTRTGATQTAGFMSGFIVP
ncbi:MAG TPA: hypothetical protein VE825_12375, partial [Terriglobales bacterium]|nr:hypothetical protein [Terriglobales bacterium]